MHGCCYLVKFALQFALFGCSNSAARFRLVPLVGLVPSPQLPLEFPISLGLADFAWASHRLLQNQSGGSLDSFLICGQRLHKCST